MALELRPSCENCERALPPNAVDARICSFECTFCSECVERLGNVCPNCGGGFVSRPIRPSAALARHPASTLHTHRRVDFAAHEVFAAAFRGVPPDQR